MSQVTRLKCGGFSFAIRLNHTMSDGFGICQFMTAIAEMACGALAPSIFPVWQRTLLNAMNPPKITCLHHEYDQVEENAKNSPHDTMVYRSFFFGPIEKSIIRNILPTHLRNCSSFELLSAYIWRLRTISLQLTTEENVRFLGCVNLRTKFNLLPSGYYGNAFAFPAALTTARKLCQSPLGYAIELIKKAKAEVTEEYMRSVANFMVINGRPHFTVAWSSYLVSDLTKIGLGEVDYGWGNAIFAGPSMGEVDFIHCLINYFIPFTNRKREKGIIVPICLPVPAMEKFVAEIDVLLKVKESSEVENYYKSKTIASALLRKKKKKLLLF